MRGGRWTYTYFEDGICPAVFCLVAYRQFLVTGDGNGKVAFWKFHDGKVIEACQLQHDIGPTCFLKVRGDQVIASTYSGLISVWRLKYGDSNQQLTALRIFCTNVNYWEMDVDVDREFAVSASSDGIRIWRFQENNSDPPCLRIVDTSYFDFAVLLLTNTDFLLVAKDGNSFTLMRKATGAVVSSFRDANDIPKGCAVSDIPTTVTRLGQIGRFLVATYAEGWTRMWDLDQVVEECCRMGADAANDPNKCVVVQAEIEFHLDHMRMDYTESSVVYYVCKPERNEQWVHVISAASEGQ